MNNERQWPAFNATTNKHVATHVRIEGLTGKKVWWIDLEGRSGLPEGVKVADFSLYGIHKASLDREIVVVEGETCVDVLRDMNLSAVGSVCGAASIPGDLALKDLLVFPSIVLWADNDDAGYRHMNRIASRLTELGATDIRVVRWEEAPDKGDCVDAIEAGVDVRKLISGAVQVSETETPENFDDDEKRTSIHFYTASELIKEDTGSVEFVCDPWVVAGSITELSGKIKRAGKTTFVTNLCSAVVKGEDFLGNPTVARPVIYMTEQPKTSFKEALRRARLTEQKNFHVVVWGETIGLPWDDVASQVITRAIELNGLIVVDTLPQFADIRGDGENSVGEALAAMEPLQSAASKGIGVLAVRHARKIGGNLGDSARGSSAFGGAVDTLVDIDRPGGNTDPNVRVVSSISRFDGVPDKLYVELTEDGYIPLGSIGAFSESRATQLILDNTPEFEADAMTLDDFVLNVESLKKTTASKVLRQLVDEEKLLCHGTGKRGSPVYYWRA
jgi:hypothetical protein